jgi:choline-sulfatase
VHQTGYWDNALAYDGRHTSWGHVLQRAGVRCESIGKLHYVNGEASTGFDAQHLAMHLKDGVGMVQGSIRGQFPGFDRPARTPPKVGIVASAGAGESSYTQYDRAIAARAVEWLEARAGAKDGQGWTLFVSFVSPHYPLTVPEEFLTPYLKMDLPPPIPAIEEGYVPHPWCAQQARPVAEIDQKATRLAVASYYGLCSFVDALAGSVLDALERSGMAGATRVVFTSDHGECMGKRGLWGKSVLYREAVEVPMIATGEGFVPGAVCETPVSLIDMYPTILDCAGLDPALAEDRPGRSLADIAAGPPEPQRLVFSEYHAMASPAAAYMLRRGRYKYHHYAGPYSPEMFDLQNDPAECVDISNDPSVSSIRCEFENILAEILDPTETDVRAKADQRALVERFGGPEAVFARFATGAKGYTEVPESFLTNAK